MPSKKKTPARKIEPIFETIHAKHEFTQAEVIDLSKQLGRTCTEISTLESEKSAVTKDFGSRIETKEIARDQLVEKVTSGYEMRATQCVVILDVKNRSKDYFRREANDKKGEFIERREMTPADFQLSLLPKPDAEKPKEKVTMTARRAAKTQAPQTEAENPEVAKSVTSDPETTAPA